jgi:hypothetical protein
MLCVSLAAAVSGGCGGNGDRAELALGVEGPQASSSIEAPRKTPLTAYGADSPSRLSVLVDNTQSNWLDLAHGLKAIGVPFSVTTSYREALGHRVILIYPLVSGRALTRQALRALAEWTRNGGTLIGVNVLGALNALFGFSQPAVHRKLVRVNFLCGTTPPCDFQGDAETSIQIGDLTQPQGILGTTAYSDLRPGVRVLARYESGAAAAIMRQYGKGRAVALGLDIGQLMYLGYSNRSQGVAESYVDSYEPTIDVFLRLLRGVYVLGNPLAITLSPTPNGKQLTVMLTHDLDFYPSFCNAVQYATFEHDTGVRATYFVQTKYITDWEDRAFLTPQNVACLKRLKALGMELDSHTVSHSYQFNHFPEGTGREGYPDYRPFETSKDLTEHGTVMGETRVSRFLLEKLIGLKTVPAFRAGYLRNPRSLPQTLQATGYSFSSTTTANASLTHLPYQLNYGDDADKELNIFEFPITIEDQRPPLLPQRLGSAIRIAHEISREQGTFVLLIHPNITGMKLAFERHLVSAIKPFSYFTTVGSFGRWWRARNAVTVAARGQGETVAVTLSVPLSLTGLTLALPAGRHLLSAEGTSATQHGDEVVLGRAHGTVKLILGRSVGG